MDQLLTADELMSNAGLVTRVRDTAATGVDDALKTLYADHGRALLAYAERFTNDRGRAEDVVQETFLRAWRRLPGLLEDDRSMRAWLFLVTLHYAISQLRRQLDPRVMA